MPRSVASGYVLGVIAATCILAVIYLPLFESLSETGILTDYGERKYFPVYPAGVLSLFTPSHFYESYNAMEEAARTFYPPPPTILAVTGNVVFHFGIVGLCLAACSVRLRSMHAKWLAIACYGVLAIVIGRIFGVPVISDLVGILPVLRNIGGQYWWGAVAMPMSLVVALRC